MQDTISWVKKRQSLGTISTFQVTMEVRQEVKRAHESLM